MHLRASLAPILLLLLHQGCSDAKPATSSASQGEEPANVLAESAEQPPAVVEPSKPALIADTKETGPADEESARATLQAIATDVVAIRNLPTTDLAAIQKAINTLAAKGPLAFPELAKFIADPNAHRDIQGVSAFAYADLASFDPAELQKLLAMDQSMAGMAGLRRLTELGGAELQKQLREVVAKRSSLSSSATIKTWLDDMKPEPIAEDRALEALRTLQHGCADSARCARASAVLTVDYPKAADWGARKLLLMPSARTDTQMQAAILLSNLYAESISPELLALTNRDMNRFVRLEAIKAIAKLGEAGTQFIEKLAKQPGEPLLPHIQKLLDAEMAAP